MSNRRLHLLNAKERGTTGNEGAVARKARLSSVKESGIDLRWENHTNGNEQNGLLGGMYMADPRKETHARRNAQGALI
jgi:hypothetical protein